MSNMRAMLLTEPKTPLQLVEVPIPRPHPFQVLIKVKACGVCRTDLHIVDGELPSPKLPLIPGHQVVGEIVELGQSVTQFKLADRVGVVWLGGSCMHCTYCRSKQENLCDQALYTGYQIDGGYAQYCVADARFIFPIPNNYSDVQAAPLLCAGLIGYRALRMTHPAKKIGFFGFGASAHLLVQVVNYQGGEVFAFTHKPEFAKEMGAAWVGRIDEKAPYLLDAAIIFAPDGSLVPIALQAVKKGGSVVCAGIYMSDIPSFPYNILWEERVLRSVSNLTRKDGEEFLTLAPQIPIQTKTTIYPLEKLNQALDDLRTGNLAGAAVITINA